MRTPHLAHHLEHAKPAQTVVVYFFIRTACFTKSVITNCELNYHSVGLRSGTFTRARSRSSGWNATVTRITRNQLIRKCSDLAGVHWHGAYFFQFFNGLQFTLPA
jgi:hypothetical protein